MADENQNIMKRRIASISNHLIPLPSFPNSDSVSFSGASMDDSYHRKHGEVPTDPVVWSIAGENFTDIIYEKAVGEAIAKARLVAGYAVGGGHILHMVCDLTIAADNAIFGQTGPKVGSFDAGYGSSIMSRLVGPKKAREMWFLTRFYSASEADKMGLVNTVVPVDKLEEETIKWCREILRNSPTAIRVLKSALNAVDDGHAGLQALAGDATLIFYGTEESNEGRQAYMEHRPPDFSKFSRKP